MVVQARDAGTLESIDTAEVVFDSRRPAADLQPRGAQGDPEEVEVYDFVDRYLTDQDSTKYPGQWFYFR